MSFDSKGSQCQCFFSAEEDALQSQKKETLQRNRQVICIHTLNYQKKKAGKDFFISKFVVDIHIELRKLFLKCPRERFNAEIEQL